MKEAPSGIEPLIAVLQTAPLATCVRRVLLKSAPYAMRFTPKRKGPPPWSEPFLKTSMLIQEAERWEIRNGYYHGDVALLHLPCSFERLRVLSRPRPRTERSPTDYHSL